MLRIHLFGAPQIWDDQRPLPLPAPPKAFELCAYLLLNRHQPLPRDQAAFTLWPDVPEDQARANLRRHLHLLRQQLPCRPDTPWILTTRRTIQWNPDASCRLDVALLDQFTPNAAGDEEWRTLIEGYRGDLLEGFYDDWVLAERARLHLRYVRLLEQRIAQQKLNGDLPGAIRTTQRLLVRDPLREELYRHLMELYYRAGDRAAALREFEKCQAVLQAELEVEPMPETLALRDAIVKGAPLHPLEGTAPPQPQSAPDNVLPPSPPLSLAPRRIRSAWLGVGLALIAALVTAGLWAAGVFSPDSASPVVTTSLSGPAVVQDTWIDKLNPDTPYDPVDPERTLKADYHQVHIIFFGFPYDRVLLRFNLAQFSPRVTVQQAVLNVHLDNFINENLPEPRPATISAFRILRPWQPDTATYHFPWSQPGMAADVDYDSRPLGSQDLHSAAWLSFDLTDLAQEWVAHPDQNFGVMLMITAAPQGAHYWVDATEYPLTDRRPRLDLTYTP